MRPACRMTIEEDSGRFTQRFLSTESGRFRSNVEAGRRRRAMRPKSNAPRRSDTPTLAAYTLQRFKRYPCQRFVAGTGVPRVVANLSELAIQGQRRPIMRHGRTVKERLRPSQSPHRMRPRDLPGTLKSRLAGRYSSATELEIRSHDRDMKMMRVVQHLRDSLQRFAAIVSVLWTAQTHADRVRWIAIRRKGGTCNSSYALIAQLQRKLGRAPITLRGNG